ncbi:hypothetical protein PAECIP111893_01667 [Paenibacillus plantiphilus]|uniref:GmrSD restriction endonucleases N-terminal domain-containing protein n=1 Tax=Paenibacillus plantiphilus TaxID=2905650 RepID=A0ABN8GC74_9BACL|nr:DUF262 domain-containing protein [Paenibacillus plantiphilus]CAH1201596.1 hypothetical protein PAECIP111893_01667 [Paenibacillus plantiphilus]
MFNLERIEKQINDERKTVDYDTREFTIEIWVQKYETGLEADKNEIYVPEYQREFVWDDEKQSKFIESLILGLPIPILFLAENSDGRLEIVDGSQRIRTLAAFLNNKIKLTDLQKLSYLNNLCFKDLDATRQRKFRNIAVRTIVLSEDTTDTVKNDMFERINRGSELLTRMESRKGIYWGQFSDFIFKVCGENEDFKKVAPVHESWIKRQEHEELILRFFALVDLYPNYPDYQGIARTLDNYFIKKNNTFSDKEANDKTLIFTNMISFVEKHFKYGFSKNSYQQVSRVYFEAISVGIALALKQRPNLKISENKINSIINDSTFNNMISGKYKTHTPDRLLQRINYMKDSLLENSYI